MNTSPRSCPRPPLSAPAVQEEVPMKEDLAVQVAVAVVTDDQQRHLWVWNDKWGAFGLPMTKLRLGPDGREAPEWAVLRRGRGVGCAGPRHSRHAPAAVPQRQLLRTAKGGALLCVPGLRRRTAPGLRAPDGAAQPAPVADGDGGTRVGLRASLRVVARDPRPRGAGVSAGRCARRCGVRGRPWRS